MSQRHPMCKAISSVHSVIICHVNVAGQGGLEPMKVQQRYEAQRTAAAKSVQNYFDEGIIVNNWWRCCILWNKKAQKAFEAVLISK
jgi:hypothetical protein